MSAMSELALEISELAERISGLDRMGMDYFVGLMTDYRQENARMLYATLSVYLNDEEKTK